jgi:hypothetical protein
MIVIPMAGMSSRFFKAGYKKPKYMLEADEKSLFNYSVESFEAYFKTDKFIFIIRDVFGTDEFVRQQVSILGIVDFDIVVLENETRGQAETVALGLQQYRTNIDTFRPDFSYPELNNLGDGYLEVFIGTGSNWSFVRPAHQDSSIINLTTEKNPISDLCCTGLYHFKHISDFFDAYEYYLHLPKEQWEKGEIYVAPLYNYLIQKGKEIHYNLIERSDVVFCGTPDEYDEFIKK